MYYAIIFILISIFAYCCTTFKTTAYTYIALYVMCFVLIFFTSGLRYETGGDWTSYTEIFQTIESIDKVIDGHGENFKSIPLETGFKYLNSISRFICDNVQFLFFTVAFIISLLLFVSIPKYSPLPILSVLIYFGVLFFSLDMIVIRQGIAVSIVFFSYRYILQQSLLRYLILVIIASLFHVSALLLVPIYWICRKRYSSKGLVITFVIFLIIYFFRIQWLNGTFQFVLNILTGSDIAGKVYAYTTRDAYAVQRGFSLGMIINVLLFPLFIYIRKSIEHYKYFNLFLNIFVCYLFVYFCMFEFVEISSRLKYYFMISLIILLPMWVSNYRKLFNRSLSCIIVCLFSLMYCKAQLFELPIASAFNPYQNYIIYMLFDKKSTGYERLMKSDNEFNKERGL